MKKVILTLVSLVAASTLWAQEIDLQWVGEKPQTPSGQSWGVPFLPGELVDGNRFHTDLAIPYTCVVKGDATYANIAAASVLAKTHRDEYMMRLHEEYPMYGWDSNKGYPTKKHRAAIEQYGTTPYHRMTFRLLDTQQTLNFDYE